MLWKDTRGQDFIEYSLLAAFAAILIGAVLPYPFLGSLENIYTKLLEVFHRLVPS